MEQKKLPTIKEIAKKLNISASTVSRALHNHPSIGWVTTMRVHKLAAELNYEPNQTAIFFKQRKTFTIGVILPHLSEHFFSSAISGIEDYSGKKNYTVLMGQSLDDPEREMRLIESMKKHRVDGLLVSITKKTDDYTPFENLAKSNIPVVYFDRIPALNDIHYIACDLKTGMLDAIDLLAARGHRHIGFINGPAELLASKERMDAYQKGISKNDIALDPQLVQTSDLSADDNRGAMERLLIAANRPTAVITFNDYVALDAMKVAREHHLKANTDIHFISFANLPIWDYMENPPMASIEQFPYQQGEKAAEILLALLDDSRADGDGTPLKFEQIILQSALVEKS
ncbi:MAG: LacI family DNA-binding transcriptional regulator [Mucilaginibacter polytrichastri]|nr:LacI family DNA-binding transcriptional regulator [Mucilaginibacter polytrichastri]